jgi:hypothetical protein
MSGVRYEGINQFEIGFFIKLTHATDAIEKFPRRLGFRHAILPFSIRVSDERVDSQLFSLWLLQSMQIETSPGLGLA